VLESTTVKASQRAAKSPRRPRLTAPHRLTPRAAVRRFNGLVHKFTAELLSGGRRSLTVFEREMVRQAAAMVLRAEQLQAAIVSGEDVDHDALVRVTSEMRRAVGALNLPTEHEPESNGALPSSLVVGGAK
jgi:hypothetical protein